MPCLSREIRDIRIDEINMSEPKVVPCLSLSNDEESKLRISIKGYGILIPVSIFELNGMYEIADGWKRVMCAMKEEMDVIPVMIHNINKVEAIYHYVQVNVNSRGLTDGEKVIVIKRLIEIGCDVNEIIKRVLPSFGYEPSISLAEKFIKAGNFDRRWIEALHRGFINIPSLLLLNELSEEEREFIFRIICRFSINTGFFTRIWRLIRELRLRGVSLHNWIDAIKKIEEVTPDNIFKALHELCYPSISKRRDYIKQITDDLDRHGIKVSFHPFLEDDKINVSLSGKTNEELKQKVVLLERCLNEGRFERILSIISGEI